MEITIALALFHWIDFLSGEGLTNEQIEQKVKEHYKQFEGYSLGEIMDMAMDSIKKWKEARSV